MSDLPVILYGYNGSPFATKIIYILDLKGISYKFVDVSMILPRPQITDLLGIPYRKIPILAIGNDVYCDTSLIAFTLERRFPASKGFETIFPSRKGAENSKEIGLQKAFTVYYTDRPLFGLTSSTIPFDTFPEAFLKDRSAFSGAKIDPKKRIANQPAVWSSLSSHLALAEQQLSDGREFYLDTVSPSLADIAMFFNFSWIMKHKGMDKVLDSSKLPHYTKWFDRISTILKQKKTKNSVKKIDGKEAAKLITSSTPSDAEIKHIGFDNTQASFLNVKQGGIVSVTPDDTGATHPTVGKLLSLSTEEVVVEVQGKEGKVRVHLPRLAFSIRSDAAAKL